MAVLGIYVRFLDDSLYGSRMLPGHHPHSNWVNPGHQIIPQKNIPASWQSSLTLALPWRTPNICKRCKSPRGFDVFTPWKIWKINGWNLQITHLERKMIWTKPPGNYVPVVNLPGCMFLFKPNIDSLRCGPGGPGGYNHQKKWSTWELTTTCRALM